MGKIIGYCEKRYVDLEARAEKNPIREPLIHIFLLAVGCAVGSYLTGFLTKKYGYKNPGFLIVGMGVSGGILTFAIIMGPEMIGSWSCSKKNKALIKEEIAKWVTIEGRPTEKALQKIQAQCPGANDPNCFYTIHFEQGASSHMNEIVVQYHSGDSTIALSKTEFSLWEVPTYLYQGKTTQKQINPEHNEHDIVFVQINPDQITALQSGQSHITIQIVGKNDKKKMVAYPDCKIKSKPYPHLSIGKKRDWNK